MRKSSADTAVSLSFLVPFVAHDERCEDAIHRVTGHLEREEAHMEGTRFAQVSVTHQHSGVCRCELQSAAQIRVACVLYAKCMLGHSAERWEISQRLRIVRMLGELRLETNVPHTSIRYFVKHLKKKHLQDNSQGVEMLLVVHQHDSADRQSLQPVDRLQNSTLEPKTAGKSWMLR